MNIKLLSFLFLSISYSIVFTSYHPEVGWNTRPKDILLAIIIANLLVFSALSVLKIMCDLLNSKGRLWSILLSAILAPVLILFAWVQVDYFLKTSMDFTFLKLPFAWRKQAFLVGILGFTFFYLVSRLSKDPFNIKKRYLYILPALSLMGIVWLQTKIQTVDNQLSNRFSSSKAIDVIILTFDSLEQEYLDFSKPETAQLFPFLSSKAGEFLQAVSSYPNACCTHGATAALYTGVPTTQNKVLYPPARLRDQWVEFNLPSLLKSLGYETHSHISSQWGNPNDLGIAHAFSYINGKSIPNSLISYFRSRFLYHGYDKLVAIHNLLRKVLLPYVQRYTKAVYNTESLDFQDELFNPLRQWHNDEAKLNSLLSLLENRKQLTFAHYHFMGLHGVNYNSTKHLQDFRNFDRYIEKVYSTLVSSGRLDKTILVINSDHGKSWTITKVPLMFRFPNGEHAGMISENTQSIDISPTILSFLNINHNLPFSGASLLSPNKLNPLREIIIAATVIHDKEPSSPNYMIGTLLVLKGKTQMSFNAENLRNDSKGNVIY